MKKSLYGLVARAMVVCGGYEAILSSAYGASGECAWVGTDSTGGSSTGAGGMQCAVGGTSSGSQGWPWIGMCMILEAGSEHLCGSRGQGWLWTPTQWLYWVPGPGH